MNRRQKALLTESILVLAATVLAVVGLIHLKDYINRSEAMRAMGQLGGQVLEYRKQNGSLPPESFVSSIKGRLEGAARLGNVKISSPLHRPRCPRLRTTSFAYSLRALPHLALAAMGIVVLRSWTEPWSGWRLPRIRRTSLPRRRSPAEPSDRPR